MADDLLKPVSLLDTRQNFKPLPQSGTEQIAQANTPEAKEKKAHKAATDFEALLLQQMFSSMWKSSSITGEEPGREEATFRDMLNEGLASQVAKSKGIGVANILKKAFDAENMRDTTKK